MENVTSSCVPYPPLGTMTSLSSQTNGDLDNALIFVTVLVDMFARNILIAGFLRSLLT